MFCASILAFVSKIFYAETENNEYNGNTFFEKMYWKTFNMFKV